MKVFSSNASNRTATWRILFTYAEALLAGKKRFHVLDAECGNAKQMISVGASHNTCHLFTGKITTEGERWIVSGIFYT